MFRRILFSLAFASVLAVLAFFSFHSGPALAQSPTATPSPRLTFTPAPIAAELLKVDVVTTISHDPDAYTQGLLLHDGWLYESAGEWGKSDLRRVDPATGEVQQMVDLPVDDPSQYFAEGLALVGDKLIQLTWKNDMAFVYDRETFEKVGEFTYTGEGWGLCYDGESLFMSDGSANLFRRDPETFELLETIPVLYEGSPVKNLNELECVGDTVYANIWFSEYIVRIDKATGVVTAAIDATGLLTPEDRATLPQQGVLNGIAYDAERDLFLITGKNWPKMFEVRFVPVG